MSSETQHIPDSPPMPRGNPPYESVLLGRPFEQGPLLHMRSQESVTSTHDYLLALSQRTERVFGPKGISPHPTPVSRLNATTTNVSSKSSSRPKPQSKLSANSHNHHSSTNSSTSSLPPWETTETLGFDGKPLSEMDIVCIRDTWNRLGSLISYHSGGFYVPGTLSPEARYTAHQVLQGNEFGVKHHDMRMDRFIVKFKPLTPASPGTWPARPPLTGSGAQPGFRGFGEYAGREIESVVLATGWEHASRAPLWSCADMPPWLKPHAHPHEYFTWEKMKDIRQAIYQAITYASHSIDTNFSSVNPPSVPHTNGAVGTDEKKNKPEKVEKRPGRRGREWEWIVAYVYGKTERWFEGLVGSNWGYRDTAEVLLVRLKAHWERERPDVPFPLEVGGPYTSNVNLSRHLTGGGGAQPSVGSQTSGSPRHVPSRPEDAKYPEVRERKNSAMVSKERDLVRITSPGTRTASVMGAVEGIGLGLDQGPDVVEVPTSFATKYPKEFQQFATWAFSKAIADGHINEQGEWIGHPDDEPSNMTQREAELLAEVTDKMRFIGLGEKDERTGATASPEGLISATKSFAEGVKVAMNAFKVGMGTSSGIDSVSWPEVKRGFASGHDDVD